MDNSTAFGILRLGTLHGILNIFHQCLVSYCPFADTGRFLAGLFTFLSRRPNVNQLRASGRNWFRTTVMNDYVKNQVRVFCIVIRCMMMSCEMWSVLHANEWQETMCVETDLSSEVPLDLQLSKLTCFNNWLGTTMWLSKRDGLLV